MAEQPAVALTLAELVRAFGFACYDGSDTRLRKWVDAYGTASACDVTSEQFQIAAQAMLDHDYKASAVNRELSALGRAHRWARETRQACRGVRQPRHVVWWLTK